MGPWPGMGLRTSDGRGLVLHRHQPEHEPNGPTHPRPHPGGVAVQLRRSNSVARRHDRTFAQVTYKMCQRDAAPLALIIFFAFLSYVCAMVDVWVGSLRMRRRLWRPSRRVPR